MLISSACLLALAAAVGLALAALHGGALALRMPPWWAGAAHGALGVIGTLLLVTALRNGAPPKPGMGVDQFGVAAAALFSVAGLSGLGPIVARARRRPMPMLLLGLHATFALMGLVVLAAAYL